MKYDLYLDYKKTGIALHHSIMKVLYSKYCESPFVNQTDFIEFANSLGIEHIHSVLIWQAFDFMEEQILTSRNKDD